MAARVDCLIPMYRFLYRVDLRLLPAGVSGVFLALQLVGALITSVKHIRKRSTPQSESQTGDSDPSDITPDRRLVQKLQNLPYDCGGFRTFGFLVARVVGALALLYLSTITTLENCKKDSVEDLVGCPEFWVTAAFVRRL